MIFVNEKNHISFRHHTYHMLASTVSINLNELGPRIEMKLYFIKLSTIEDDQSTLEWLVRSHARSAAHLKICSM